MIELWNCKKWQGKDALLENTEDKEERKDQGNTLEDWMKR